MSARAAPPATAAAPTLPTTTTDDAEDARVAEIRTRLDLFRRLLLQAYTPKFDEARKNIEQTVMMRAAKAGQVEVVAGLLRRGADIEAKGKL